MVVVIGCREMHSNCSRIDKLTGALYLGDLVRRILAQLVLDGFLFSGKPCEKLDEVDSFPTKFISEILALVVFYFICDFPSEW